MSQASSYFDQSAAGWDNEPRRIDLMKSVGEAILREARPTAEMDVLDYGCGTGLVGLFLLPHVRSVTGADSSPGMLEVLRKKIAESGLEAMRAVELDLQRDPLPPDRYDLIVSCMVLHHVADVETVLGGLHDLLRPGGTLCLADLDTEPGLFHPPQAAASVHHHGFDRRTLMEQLERIGFTATRDVTAHVVSRPVADGTMHDFPVFLIVARATPHGM